MAELSSISNPTVTLLSDYRQFSHKVEQVTLDFELDATKTIVRSKIQFSALNDASSMALDGENLKLLEIRIDGKPLSDGEFTYEGAKLTLNNLPPRFLFESVVEIDPENNTALEGLYISGGRFCTQCESESFRRITFYPDRPDVLTTFEVKIVADKANYPTLLSNGDLIKSGDLENGKHFAVWRDPFPKPAYLFALVAGNFDTLRDNMTTVSGKQVDLFIHVDPGDLSRAEFAMQALKASMAWDERVFQREYDLSEFHIVAVRDFNYGAMENKGLNIFNSSLLLADPHVSSDADFAGVERVVAHEYFHNWTGNRITLRDWFQLCLKEGLTVYRDQEFSSDMNSRPVQRINDVLNLREAQYPEDAGPLAHPPRPDHYESITNFYTPTVYRKGAEVVRVLRSLVGEDIFAAGMQLYFDRCDGKAATLEDFVACFEEVGEKDLRAFFRWYTQAGTPAVSVSRDFDDNTDTMHLEISQETRPGGGEPNALPLPIPLKIGFIDRDGNPVPARLNDENEKQHEHHVVLNGAHERFAFRDVDSGAIPAILRGFGAPVKIRDDLTLQEQLVQAAHDPDPFTRWDAGQSALIRLILDGESGNEAVKLASAALSQEIERSADDAAFSARAISIPALSVLMQNQQGCDPEKLFNARERIYTELAKTLESQLVDALRPPSPNGDDISGLAKGRRAFRGACLSYLARLGSTHVDLIAASYANAKNMTERQHALSALTVTGGDAYNHALAEFHDLYEDEPLALDKWFSIQSSSAHQDAIATVGQLANHNKFTWKNPNRVRSVFGAFGTANPRHFHRADGAGYLLVIDAVKRLDGDNPMTAARLIRAFEACDRLEPNRRILAKNKLQNAKQETKLSKNVTEMISRIVGAKNSG